MEMADCFYVTLGRDIWRTRQISNLRSQDVSKEILSDIGRKDVAEFSNKISHFQYATLEMFKAALNNYSMLTFN